MTVAQVWSERNKLTSLCPCVDADPWYLPVMACEAGRALFKSLLGIATVVGAMVEQGSCECSAHRQAVGCILFNLRPPLVLHAALSSLSRTFLAASSHEGRAGL